MFTSRGAEGEKQIAEIVVAIRGQGSPLIKRVGLSPNSRVLPQPAESLREIAHERFA